MKTYDASKIVIVLQKTHYKVYDLTSLHIQEIKMQKYKQIPRQNSGGHFEIHPKYMISRKIHDRKLISSDITLPEELKAAERKQ